MSEAEELAKARLHNVQAVQRNVFQRALRRRLSGRPDAAEAVARDFDPLVKASQERRSSGNPG